jgi:hypothetical protein
MIECSTNDDRETFMWRTTKKWANRIIVLLFVLLLTTFSVIELSIGWGVRSSIRAAQKQFPGDRVKALIAMVECRSCEMNDRNRAVWALGQLDDARAAQVLEKYYTGKPCNHLNNICQEKLRIALRHLRHEDGNRYESFLWRWMLAA